VKGSCRKPRSLHLFELQEPMTLVLFLLKQNIQGVCLKCRSSLFPGRKACPLQVRTPIGDEFEGFKSSVPEARLLAPFGVWENETDPTAITRDNLKNEVA
jgi:hypothetical protein